MFPKVGQVAPLGVMTNISGPQATKGPEGGPWGHNSKFTLDIPELPKKDKKNVKGVFSCIFCWGGQGFLIYLNGAIWIKVWENLVLGRNHKPLY